MIKTIFAALVAAIVLPAAAQTPSTPRTDARQATVQKPENKVVADSAATPKEKSCVEKLQNKQGRKIAKKKVNQKKVVS